MKVQQEFYRFGYKDGMLVAEISEEEYFANTFANTVRVFNQDYTLTMTINSNKFEVFIDPTEKSLVKNYINIGIDLLTMTGTNSQLLFDATNRYMESDDFTQFIRDIHFACDKIYKNLDSTILLDSVKWLLGV
jgi:hypothetical protein